MSVAPDYVRRLAHDMNWGDMGPQPYKKNVSNRALALSIAIAVGAFSPVAFADPTGPTGGVVTGGQATINTPNQHSTLIQQQSQNAVIDWQTFNVGQNHTVQFAQPNANATALNRIHDQNPSQIFGAIIANGNVFLLNPNGIVFGETATVNVNSLMATTLNVSPEDFMSGNWSFEQVAGNPEGMIVNRGLIAAATAGSVTLVAGAVVNSGVILADYGQVTLAGATRTYVDFDGDGMLRFEISGTVGGNPNGLDAAVANHGTIQANGGQILLTAQTADAIFAAAVNNTGVIQANRIENVGGVIRLGGGSGDVINTGTIVAQGIDGDGGSVEITGATVSHFGTIDVSSQTGQGGTIHLLGDKVGLFDEAVLDASGALGGGTISVGGTSIASVTYVAPEVVISADALGAGTGGVVAIQAGDTARVFGSISATGGVSGGDGGSVSVAAPALIYNGFADLTAPLGKVGTLTLAAASVEVQDLPVPAPTPDDPFRSAGSEYSAILSWRTLEVALGHATVTVSTLQFEGIGSGEIAIRDGYTWDRNNLLTLESAGGITLHEGAHIQNFGIGGLTLNGAGAVVVLASITLNGGDFSSEAGSFDSLMATISTANPNGAGGSVDISAQGDLKLGNLDSSGTGGEAGDISLVSHLGTITMAGDLTATSDTSEGGDIALTGAVELLGEVRIDTRGGAGNGSVVFHDIVNASGTDPPSFVANSLNIQAGAVSFKNSLGGTAPIGALNVAATGAITLGNGSSMTLATANGALVLAGSVLLNAPVTLSTGAGEITIDSITGNGHALAVDNFGDATFGSIDLGGGEFDLTAVSGGTISTGGSFSAGSVSTGVGAYHLIFQGGGSVTGSEPTVFGHRGNLSIGASFAFASGVSTSGPPDAGPSVILITGDATIASNANIDFSNTPIQVTPGATFQLRADSEIRTGDIAAPEGTVIVNGHTVRAYGAITVSSANGKGGTVQLLGEYVGLFGGASIDASGATGGGTVLVGGDYQGANAAIRNAQVTYIDGDAVIRADATGDGDGGRIIIWADDTTRFYGTISARGGATGGDGGFVEVSGKQSLAYRGITDLRAPHGVTGTLLLDPKNIIIATGGAAAVVDAVFATAPAGDITIAPDDIVTALDGANVILQANNDITVTDAIDASANTGNFGLTLQAGRSILINANITLRGSFTATANDAGADAANRDAGDAVFSMFVGTTINTNAGAQNGAISISYGVGAGTGDLATGTMNVGALTAGTGAITLNTTANSGPLAL